MPGRVVVVEEAVAVAVGGVDDLADALVALGTARLVMGLPLYGLALWVAWMITRPEALGDPGAQDAARQDVLDGEAAATDRRDGLS